jgi:SAM-dependent methyltransferase
MTRNAYYLILLLVWDLLYSCSAFAGFGASGGNKQQPNKNKPPAEKKRRDNKDKGGGNNHPTKQPSPSSSSPPQKKTITLGPNKSVEIWVPPNALEDGDSGELSKFASAAASSSLLQDYASYRGTGDVIWPSALHLSRLVANCPSFVTDRRVLDLGCGLGLASLAVLLGNPTTLALSDIDETVLDWAMKSCEDHWSDTNNNNDHNNHNSAPLQRLPMDWSDPSTWMTEKGAFDVVLASDVLYDTEATEHVAKLLAHVLLGSGDDDDDDDVLKRALIVDPANRPYRDAFVEHAAKNGLLAAPVPFPGQDEFVLINVTPLS